MFYHVGRIKTGPVKIELIRYCFPMRKRETTATFVKYEMMKKNRIGSHRYSAGSKMTQLFPGSPGIMNQAFMIKFDLSCLRGPPDKLSIGCKRTVDFLRRNSLIQFIEIKSGNLIEIAITLSIQHLAPIVRIAKKRIAFRNVPINTEWGRTPIRITIDDIIALFDQWGEKKTDIPQDNIMIRMPPIIIRLQLFPENLTEHRPQVARFIKIAQFYRCPENTFRPSLQIPHGEENHLYVFRHVCYGQVRHQQEVNLRVVFTTFQEKIKMLRNLCKIIDNNTDRVFFHPSTFFQIVDSLNCSWILASPNNLNLNRSLHNP